MSDSFASTSAHLITQIHAARTAGETRAAGKALDELLAVYTRLGNRQAGTVEQQNTYIIARTLGVLPEALQQLGVRPEDLPMPARRGRPAPPPARSVDEARIADRFAHAGAPDEPEARFAVRERPGDNMRHHGKLLPYAVVDTHDGKPVSWYDDRDLAETVADTATRLREAG
ncbi:hypothetical protein ACGFYQ_33705 [Streptomyces sp. NPDC048258]|uniref:hypothetical protein n=1 Tax=Streptomyces sp. NPDC048258 TaxID=3365527 RepID=UPI003723E2EB